MIEKFTREDFETYLKTNHPEYSPLGLIDGEECYNITLDNQVSITIRSSIKSNGMSADVGKDSIRCWLIVGNNTPLGSKVSKWTTRQPGWQKCLDKNILQLLKWRMLAGDCKECERPKGIFKARTLANEGRPFTKCVNCDNGFAWLDKNIDVSKIYFTGENNDTNKITRAESLARNEQGGRDKNTMSGSNTILLDSPDEVPKPGGSLQGLPKGPNQAQRSTIETDLNTDLRVLAGPGSGKTYVIEHRYKFLIDNGINPTSILVCTFGKQAATEMGQRILKTCLQANTEQICTINALCYRLLAKWYPDSRWYKWQGPKEWQIKKCLEDAIGLIWQEKEKPNSQEVYNAINTSKYLSLIVDDSYEYFVSYFGSQYGEWLYEIRSKFDAWLNRSRFLTFTDQLHLVEKRLQSDSQWREMLQSKFSHVIIDEGQDCNFQAMRILITLSLESGENTVYEEIKQ